jgi:hypothetical protein
MATEQPRRSHLGKPVKTRPPKIHFEAFLPKQREVLSASAKPARAWGAYLAGGLAVALQLGHRVSADFDWFTANTIPPDRLLDDIATTGLAVAIRQNDEGTFLGQVDGSNTASSVTDTTS